MEEDRKKGKEKFRRSFAIFLLFHPDSITRIETGGSSRALNIKITYFTNGATLRIRTDDKSFCHSVETRDR